MQEIQTMHKLTYAENVRLAVQQRTSRFEMGFTYSPDLKGRQTQLIELIGATEAILDAPRGGDTPNIDNLMEQVWCTPRPIEWGKVIEKEDAIKALTNYQSQFVQNGAIAITRGRDKIFSQAIFGDRKVGQDGTIVQAWNSTNRVVAADVGSTGATGMNLAKIQRAKRLLRAQYVELDMEELWGPLNAQEMEELYNDIINASTEVRRVAVLEDDKKMVHSVAGVNFVHYEGMADYDANTYTSAIWCKSGMYYGDFDPLAIDVGRNPAKKYRPHPYMENWFGASRTEDEKVIKILNAK